MNIISPGFRPPGRFWLAFGLTVPKSKPPVPPFLFWAGNTVNKLEPKPGIFSPSSHALTKRPPSPIFWVSDTNLSSALNQSINFALWLETLVANNIVLNFAQVIRSKCWSDWGKWWGSDNDTTWESGWICLTISRYSGWPVGWNIPSSIGLSPLCRCTASLSFFSIRSLPRPPINTIFFACTAPII